MSLTGGYDFCVEMTIAVVREIFHLAFKQEDRFPHNFGPVNRQFTVPGGSPLDATIRVRAYDEEARAADLRFTAVDTLTFKFPLDVEVLIAQAPTPDLSTLLLQLVVEVPGKLARLPASDADGPAALGVDFRGVTPADVALLSMSPLPIIDSAALTGALHQAYTSGKIPHQGSQGGFTLLIYDGGRDTTLSPPNSAGAEISATLEAGDWVRIVLPIHVSGSSSGYTLDTNGSITLYRKLVRTDDAVILRAGQVPPAADTAHATVASLDSVPDVDATVFLTALHSAYAASILPHTYSAGGGKVNFYDGTADTTLTPPHPTSAAITATLESESGTTYLHIVIPCYAEQLGFSSFGRLHIHRAVTTTASTVSVDFAAVPAPASRKTRFDMDVAMFNSGLAPYTSLVDAALAGVGVQSGPNPGSAVLQAIAQAVDAQTAAIGDVVQAAPSQARAEQMAKDEIANYFSQLKFPVYTPDPGENDVTLSEPTGKLLVPEEVLAIQLTPRAGEADEVPESFVADKRLALATGRAFLMERIADAINKTFPDLATTGKDKIEEITDRNVWLTSLSVTPGDGRLDVSGTATVEVDCWKDPDLSFSGPIFLETTFTEDEEGCHLEIQAVAGDFDVSQSSCDIFLQVIIPIVGWIVGAVIASTISAVKGGVIQSVVSSQEDLVAPIPPVVFGIAAVRSCLTDVRIRPDGLVLPGKVEVERVDRSFDELQGENRQPGSGG